MHMASRAPRWFPLPLITYYTFRYAVFIFPLFGFGEICEISELKNTTLPNGRRILIFWLLTKIDLAAQNLLSKT